MKGKGKFLYITEGNDTQGWRIVVKDSAYSYPEGTQFFSLKNFSTDDLLKVKAQIATELETRMDLDEVTEANLEKLKLKLQAASTQTVALVARQALDRKDIVAADERRVKTRLAIIQDELRSRLQRDNVSEMKFQGVLSITYNAETVYEANEGDWVPVYQGIYEEAKALEAQGKDISEAFAILQKRFTTTNINALIKQGGEVPKGVKATVVRKVNLKRTN